MVKITNIFGDVYSGQAGKAGVFAKWKGRQYRRKYVIPANPKSIMQQIVRGWFTNAVDTWHLYTSLQRLAYSYLATGLVMSGFNLYVSRRQKAGDVTEKIPITPECGIKQVASEALEKTEDFGDGSETEFPLGYPPASIGSLVENQLEASQTQDVVVHDLMGDVMIPWDIVDTQGVTGGGSTIAEGDKLLIDYHSAGRIIEKEVLYTVPAAGVKIPKITAIADALRTARFPIDKGTVKVYIEDAAASPGTVYQIESMDVLNAVTVLEDTAKITKGFVNVNKTAPGVDGLKLKYTNYTAIENAKLEVTKVDTSFITWRRYSDRLGLIPIAQTYEDQTYDSVLSKALKISEIEADRTAINTTKHELIVMTAAS
jgi:hypothetical protein